MSRYREIAGALRRVNGWFKPVGPSIHTSLTVSEPSAAAGEVALIPTAQDQGQIGDCVYQSSRELATGLAMKRGEGERLFSAMAPYYWGRRIDGVAATNDAGSTVEISMVVARRWGWPSLDAWPDSRPLSMEPDEGAALDASTHLLTLQFSLPNLSSIRASLAQGFGIAFGFDVPSQMMTSDCAANGLVEYPANASGWDGGGHAVTAWGWDDNMLVGAHRGALLCLNHWSKGWGIGGRFWLPYEYFHQGHASDAHTVRMAGV